MQMIHNIPQPHFERFVAAELSYDPHVDMRTGFAFISCVQVNIVAPEKEYPAHSFLG